VGKDLFLGDQLIYRWPDKYFVGQYVGRQNCVSCVAAFSVSLCTSADCWPTTYCVGRQLLSVRFVGWHKTSVDSRPKWTGA